MSKGGKTLIVLLAILACVAIIWGALATTKCATLEDLLTREQALNGTFSGKIADFEQENARKDAAIAELEAENTAMKEEIAALKAENEALTAQAQQLQTASEEVIAALVEARYPELVEENTRLKAQSAAAQGENLLEQETNAADEG